MVAGVGRALDAIEAFRFTDAEIDFLREHDIVDEPTLAYLADYRFTGDIWGYPEGETYFPYSPLAGRGVDVRRGGAARDGAALDLQPRLGDRVGGLPDDLGCR